MGDGQERITKRSSSVRRQEREWYPEQKWKKIRLKWDKFSGRELAFFQSQGCLTPRFSKNKT